MLDGNMKDGLTHFVSAEDKYNGLGITRDTNPFKDLSSTDALMGSYYRVGSEGKFITAREKFMWIDINHNGVGDYYDMSAEGLADLVFFKNSYVKEYKAII